jgi:hypothetical protein
MYAHTLKEMAAALVAAKVIPEEKKKAAQDVLVGYWADKIALVWSADDVSGEYPKLSEDQCIEVLQKVLDDHDCTVGVTWETIHTVARGMFTREELANDDDEDDEEA